MYFLIFLFFFFFNVTATTEIYTLSLHDALPICSELEWIPLMAMRKERARRYESPLLLAQDVREDRKSTRLNSSHEWISYAVFCLKKKKTTKNITTTKKSKYSTINLNIKFNIRIC